jgi:hypothetical protein
MDPPIPQGQPAIMQFEIFIPENTGVFGSGPV